MCKVNSYFRGSIPISVSHTRVPGLAGGGGGVSLHVPGVLSLIVSLDQLV